MSIFKRLPWTSLLLVLVSYTTLGWVLSESRMPWPLWIVVVLGVLILLASLAVPFLAMANYSSVFFESSTRTFLIAVCGAFLFFLMVAWFRLFLDTLLIISAAILAKIDFHTAGFKGRSAFLITSLFSLTGIACGAVLHEELSIHTSMW
ncbi:hypothetical protein NIES2109_43420 [Nostoc sp. HK-01]|uniref:Uncharacterized protein n=2 Tax=Nostocales TaxID=1161 RepID=A0A1Z4G9W7_9CYAN|nr:hypothetical protein [Nostoc cycadae]BAY14315.1 hypothetical protein NIES21_00720 [Anabaenopsis circularis NIES-21]BBD61514.1 hypothetical protein NIES2109_43420 [Nostoc sp. HK-01]GBE95065.1 cobalt ABC transporter, permease CbiQ [Nostoc cycadae WK-1]